VDAPLSGANNIPRVAPAAIPANRPNNTFPVFIVLVFNCDLKFILAIVLKNCLTAR
jgi:hypothetical protein